MSGQRKKKAQRHQAARSGLVSVNQNRQLSCLDGMEGASKFLSDPAFTHIMQMMSYIRDGRIANSQNHLACFKNKRGLVNPEELLKYPDSPTAQLTLCAFQNYLVGWFVINNYKKVSVDLEEDCDRLQDGIHGYALGFIQAQHMARQFPIFNENFDQVLEGYLNRRPNDSLAEFLKVSFQYLFKQDPTKSDFEQSKAKIRSLEMLAHRLSHYKENDTEMLVLSDVLYLLGSLYSVTDQDIRAVDAFNQCYQLDQYDIDALYALGYHHLHKSPSKSLDMLEKYLQLAPSCHQKFPEAHYLIGMYHVLNGQNIREAKHFYDLGQRAEGLRLPFNPPTGFPMKTLLESAVHLTNLRGFGRKSIL